MRLETNDDHRKEAAFRSIYERTHLQILSYCLRRTPEREAALDAASDVYIVAWRRFEDMPTGADGDTLVWLFAVARRVLANQRRSDDRRAGMRRRLPDRTAGEQVTPEDAALTSEQRQRLLRAMERLSADDQELLRLDTWEELPGRLLAEYFRCSENAVNVRLHRARRRLAREYDRLGRPRAVRRMRAAKEVRHDR